MIKLDRRDRRTRLFMWCLQFSLCRGYERDAEGKLLEWLKPVEWYVEHGTTLCHFFWSCFWVPLIVASLLLGLLLGVVAIHVHLYEMYGLPGLFLPAASLTAVIAVVAIILLVVIGAEKVGLWPYFLALKHKVCPRIEFRQEDR